VSNLRVVREDTTFRNRLDENWRTKTHLNERPRSHSTSRKRSNDRKFPLCACRVGARCWKLCILISHLCELMRDSWLDLMGVNKPLIHLRALAPRRHFIFNEGARARTHPHTPRSRNWRGALTGACCSDYIIHPREMPSVIKSQKTVEYEMHANLNTEKIGCHNF
jgi:hypothetical protein